MVNELEASLKYNKTEAGQGGQGKEEELFQYVQCRSDLEK